MIQNMKRTLFQHKIEKLTYLFALIVAGGIIAFIGECWYIVYQILTIYLQYF